jgi:hypothetical protein
MPALWFSQQRRHLSVAAGLLLLSTLVAVLF